MASAMIQPGSRHGAGLWQREIPSTPMPAYFVSNHAPTQSNGHAAQAADHRPHHAAQPLRGEITSARTQPEERQ